MIAARKAAGLSCADLARMSGVNYHTLRKVELGNTKPSIRTVSLVSSALRMTGELSKPLFEAAGYKGMMRDKAENAGARDLYRGMQHLVNEQRRVNANRQEVYNGSPESLGVYALALLVEIGELLQELNWKPWKEGREVNTQAVAEEMSDVLAFVGVLLDNLMVQSGLTLADIAAAYARKTDINLQRAGGEVAGYRGSDGS